MASRSLEMFRFPGDSLRLAFGRFFQRFQLCWLGTCLSFLSTSILDHHQSTQTLERNERVVISSLWRANSTKTIYDKLFFDLHERLKRQLSQKTVMIVLFTAECEFEFCHVVMK